MKNIKFLSSLFSLIAVLLVTSCQNEALDSDLLNVTPPPVGNQSFTVDMDGQPFVATSTSAVISQGLIVISGVRGNNGETVGIAIPSTTVGTYSGDVAFLSYESSSVAEYTYNNDNPTTGQSSGTVTITSINTVNQTISGTFSFIGYWGNQAENRPSIQFTNGVFNNIPYTGTIPDPGEEYFRATVNGTAKNYSNIVVGSTTESVSIGGTIVSPMSNVQVIIPTEDLLPGTYPIGNDILTGVVGKVSDGAIDNFTSVSGSLTIISITNGWIKGTFSFSAIGPSGSGQPVSVTNGSFNTELP
ncbi:hypothetical protein CHU92_06690 [Flavobacterium cyanobacteriorum]|uniref:Lipoprotein n=1 Tax=Flavobacterium cyanobacteriorum TaxID=2022802 RepID=A0A255Z9H5_9FLAO|nr:DUF6252 family protein [Flavobacterium cyanobacteriorum]OYQ38099.1 hypothetical protein CHU92_06690 [Flavobacterium cyanobacteriorum]